jgi:hypothetical protein
MSRNLPKILLVIFGLLIAVSLILSGLLFVEGSVRFFSFHPNFKWQIDNSMFKSTLTDLRNLGSSPGNLIVILSPNLKKTEEVGGIGEFDPIYYLESSKFLGLDVLKIYLDQEVWKKVDNRKDLLITVLVIKRISELEGLTEDNLSSVYERLSTGQESIFKLVKRF